LQCIFQKICQLFIFIFLFDYSNIKDQIFEYKLNGFKTLGNTIKIATVGGIDVDPSSCYAIYKIYQWLYLGGNSNDKMIIARNIISLNLEEKTLQINATTLDAILSNYKIYEKENVKQYIQVRNKLSELLIDLQTKIGGIVDGFAGDFKKNIITLLSFFISVIVIRVVSKGDFSGGFTNEVMILSIAFLLISVGLLLYARWEFTRKIDLFEKHYDQLKDRYRDLLSKEELNSIFEDCNPQNDRSNSSFVLKQKKLYTILWIISIVLLAFALVVIFFVNNPNSCSCMCELLNKIKDVIQGIFENTKSIPA